MLQLDEIVLIKYLKHFLENMSHVLMLTVSLSPILSDLEFLGGNKKAPGE